MDWKRVFRIAVGFAAWAILDALTGKPYNAEMALLAGFVVAWASEEGERSNARYTKNIV